MIRAALVIAALGAAGPGTALLGACGRDDAAPAATTAPQPAPAVTPAKVAPPRPAQLTRVTIKAIGMYCEESCPIAVRGALAGIPAIYELGFDLSKESVFVSYDAALGAPKQVTAPMLVAIRSVGFDPWLAKETWPDGVEAQVVKR